MTLPTNFYYDYSPARFIEELYGAATNQVKYPPYDIISDNDNTYEIHIAVAGFKRDEIDVSIESEKLTITGKKTEEEKEPNYVRKGIAKRDFSVDFKLIEYLVVDSADLSDGILRVKMHRELPEALQPRKIEIL